MTIKETSNRKRNTSHKLQDDIYKHSPLKNGTIKVKDEDEPYTNYSKIMKNLYLGNIEASKDKNFFKDKKIKAVLNCTKDIPHSFLSEKVEYMRIPIDDSLKQTDLEKAFKFMPAAVEFIYKHAVLQDEPTFVHCFAGRERSQVMCVAFLVAKMKMTPKEASLYVLKKRPEAMHFGESYNFSYSIDKYYKHLKETMKRGKM